MAARTIHGGRSFTYVRVRTSSLFTDPLYLVQPGLARRRLNLVNDARERRNNWNSFEAQNLTLTWEWENITANYNAEVDIALYGYWEDVEGHSLKQV